MQGHGQGRNEESGVTWSVWPSPSYLRIEERELETATALSGVVGAYQLRPKG